MKKALLGDMAKKSLESDLSICLSACLSVRLSVSVYNLKQNEVPLSSPPPIVCRVFLLTFFSVQFAFMLLLVYVIVIYVQNATFVIFRKRY